MHPESMTGLGGDADRLLAAIPAPLQDRARAVVADPRLAGRGLRVWIAFLEAEDRPLPAALSPELAEMYLKYPEAEPLHDCEACGLPVPIRARWRAGHEPSTDRVYFPVCPHCGGRTGPHAFWARAARAAAN